MGNRPCAALCYDIDHRKSVHESTKIVNKSSALWAKQLSADFDDEYEPRQNRRTSNYSDDIVDGAIGRKSHPTTSVPDAMRIPPQSKPSPSVLSATTSPSRRPSLLQSQQDLVTIGSQQQHTQSSGHYYTGFPADCRSMSSDTCGREARSEHDLSRRSSNATCEREEMRDDSNRSTS